MNQPKHRPRSILLSVQGKARLGKAIVKVETIDYKGRPLTQQKLKEHIENAHSGTKSLDIKTIKKIREGKVGSYKASVEVLFNAFGLTLEKGDYLFTESPPRQKAYQDLLEAPELPAFYGRHEEISTLENWIVKEKCKLVALLGIGGIGKTAIAVKLGNHISQQFQYVIWRSLRETPPIEKVLSDCIQFCSEQRDQLVTDSISDSITKLIHHLERNRCLLIFDNVESILEIKKQTGYHYREGYENYGNLFQRIGESKHQSCLVLTSREKPKEIAQLEGDNRPVRSLVIQGLEEIDGQKILAAEGLSTENSDWIQFFEHYSGHPFALKMASKNIQDIFGGNISEFLVDGKKVFNDIQDLLDQQFNRLSQESQSVLFWLAINREPMSISDIKSDSLSNTSTHLSDILKSLLRCFLVEPTQAGFTLQNVVMEYVTDRLIDSITQEIEAHKIGLLNSHSLIKASAKEYVYQSQCRLILSPIQDRLAADLDQKLISLLKRVHDNPALQSGYATGNILNLTSHPNKTVSNLDFSTLTIRQAYLRNSCLYNVNFRDAHFINTELAHTFGVALSITFSPDSELLAMGGMAWDGSASISIFQVKSRRLVKTFKGHTSWLRTVAFSPDGRMLVSGGEDGKICLWDVESNRCLQTFNDHHYPIWSVTFHPDGKILASGDESGEIRLWDLEKYTCLVILKEHTRRAWSIAFSPNGQMLASGSEDDTIQLWDIASPGYQCISLPTEVRGRVFSVAFSPNGKMLASGSEDGTIQLWDMENRECIQILEGTETWVWSVVFSPDGKLLASGGEDGVVRLWTINQGNYQDTLPDDIPDCKSQKVHRNRIWSVAFSPDGKNLASSSDDHTIGLWHPKTLERVHTFKTHPTGIFGVAVSHAQQILASGSVDSIIRLWNINTRKNIRQLHGHYGRVWSIVFSPNGKLMVSGSEDCTIRLWDVSSGRCLSILRENHGPAWSIDLSADGSKIVSGGVDGLVRFWDITNPHHPQYLGGLERHENWVWSTAFSPDGQTLASSSAVGTIKLWHLDTGQCFKTLWTCTGATRSVSFSPNGEIIASGNDDGKIRLWNIREDRSIGTFQGHENRIWSIAFSPEGQRLASSCEDGKIRLWDVNNHNCLKTFEGHDGAVFEIVFCPNGQKIISGSGDGTVKIWDTDLDRPVITFRTPRLYEGTNITGATGLTEGQKESLSILGAIDEANVDLGS